MDAKELGAMPAQPVECTWRRDGTFDGIQTGNDTGWAIGITLRQHFAGLAMQGALASTPDEITDMQRFAQFSVSVADALLAELAKEMK